MLVLALDSSTAAITVALHDGTSLLVEVNELGARAHAERLTPLIEQALAGVGATPRAVTDVVVGVGPGPFTSLRVGLVTAHAFALPGGIPVHGVCSLDALARRAVIDGGWRTEAGPGFLVATDARRREVYWATYDTEGRRTAGPGVDRPDVVRGAYPDLPVVGEGAVLYPEILGPGHLPVHPRAADLAEIAIISLASGAPKLAPVPLYLRRPDADQPGHRKSVLT